MLGEYFQHDKQRPSHIKLFLGVAKEERPGPRYEESCKESLLAIIKKWINKPDLEIVPQGNASVHFAIDRAGGVMESDPGALCIVGGIDSLLRDSTLSICLRLWR
jgi:3-oxoacyl-[acyl-carrier-protein] synthase-1